MPQFQVISRQIPLHPLHLSSWLLSVIASWGAISLSRVLHQALKHTQTLTRLILSVISCFWLWLQHTTPYSCHARTSNLRPLSKFAESSQVVGSLCLANMWTARQTVWWEDHPCQISGICIYICIYYIAIIHYPDIREVRGSKVNEVMILLPNHHSPGIVIVSTTFASAPGSCSVLGIPCDAERPGSWRYEWRSLSDKWPSHWKSDGWWDSNINGQYHLQYQHNISALSIISFSKFRGKLEVLKRHKSAKWEQIGMSWQGTKIRFLCALASNFVATGCRNLRLSQVGNLEQMNVS